MNKLALATGVALVALTGSAYAADLIINEPAPVVAAPAAYDAGFYFDLLGGAALDGTVQIDDVDAYDVNAGWAGAGVVGFATGLEGLSVEGDFFLSQREVDGTTTNAVLTTGSAMANLRYTVSLNDMFGVYGAVGLGGVYLHDKDDTTDPLNVDGWGLGYEVKAGVTAAVADNISLVGEVRYIDTFQPIENDAGENVKTGTAAVLAGIHFGF